ncbi:hypothetical protein NX059_012315 [Plenodomus lindquistii]|nr:hypothetical protein NX059_012315 [Plenodomus lindquistii]
MRAQRELKRDWTDEAAYAKFKSTTKEMLKELRRSERASWRTFAEELSKNREKGPPSM